MQTPDARLSIHPNPVSDMLYVTTEEVIEKYEITNLAGQLVLKKDAASEGRIALDSLSSGSYMLKVYYKDGQSQLVRFVKI